MRTIALFAALFVLAISAARGQEEAGLQGRILDANTGQPVEGANIEVVGSSFGAATDAQGYFRVQPLLRGEYSIVVSHIAYEPAQIDGIRVGPERSPFVVVRLQPRILLMPGVLVEAQREYAAAADRTVVDRKTIESAGASNLREILELMPSLVVRRGSNSSTVSIRGSNSNQVLVLFDGVPLNDPITGSVDVESLPAGLIESVEIRRTASSAQYGSGAVGGVVIVRPRRTLTSRAEIGTRSGSYGMLEATPSLQLTVPHGPSIAVTGDVYRWTGDYRYRYRVGDEERQTRRRNSDLHRTNVLLQAWGGNSIQVRSQFLCSKSERGIPGSVYALSPYARAKQRRILGVTTVRFGLLTGDADLRISLDENSSNYINRPPLDAPVRDRSVPPYDTELRYRAVGLQAEWSGHLGGGRLDASGEFRTSRLHLADRLRGVAGIENSVARLSSVGFVWRTSTRLREARLGLELASRGLLAAVQAPQIDRQYPLIAPEMALVFQHDRWLFRSASVRLSRGFRLPTYGDLFYQDYRVRGNPNLRPERSWDVVAGIRLATRAFGIQWSLQVESYRRRIYDLITWQLGAFATFSPVNVDAMMEGYEINLSFASRLIDGDFTFSNLRTRNLTPEITVYGNELPFRPAYRAMLRLVLKWKACRLNLVPQWVGPRWVTEDNTVQLPGFSTLDLSVTTRIGEVGGWRMDVQFQLLNAFDRRYEVVEGAPLPGREWRFGLSFRGARKSDRLGTELRGGGR